MTSTPALPGTGRPEPDDPVRGVLAAAHDAGVFSGAAWAVGDADGTLRSGVLGTRARTELPEAAGGRLDASTMDGCELFDLASVTKPVVGIAALALVERGVLRMDAAAGDVLAFLRGTPAGSATVRHLLLHTSGLPGRLPLWRHRPTREAWLAGLAAVSPLSRAGTRVEYSSIGFVVLGLMIEAVTGRDLAGVVDELVAVPAGAHGLVFDPPPALPVVATERCVWRGHVVQGRVHDENAAVLGAPAGHAGLFGTLDDVAGLGRALVRNRVERVLLAPSTHAAATRTGTAGLALARGLGWQAMDADAPAAGHLVGPRTYGHTGFTGTSLFVDPDTDRWYVLLTNRVHPTRADERIVGVRTAFHDVASALPGREGHA